MVLFHAEPFAEEWIEAWNSHDLDRILSHYAEDVEVTTPMIRRVMGIESGTLRGKPAVRAYWQKGLDLAPDLRFELLDAATGIDSVAVYYTSSLGVNAVEVMFFAGEKINRVVVHYTEAAE